MIQNAMSGANGNGGKRERKAGKYSYNTNGRDNIIT